MVSPKSSLFIALLIMGIMFAFMTPINFLINFAHDDSFFYLKTAYNFSQGFGSTFDQVNVTNGYHPLWFSVLVIYFFLLDLIKEITPENLFRYVAFLQYFISLSIIYLVYRIFRSNRSDEYSSRKFFLFIPLFIILVFSRDFGIESQLTCLIFSVYCYLKSKELFSARKFVFGKSILLSLIFLSRVDYLFSVIPFIILFDYITSDKDAKIRFLTNSIAVVSITAVAYFLLNKILFDHYLTVSSTSKNAFPEIIFFQNLTNMITLGPVLIHFLKSVFIMLVLLIFLFSKKNTDKQAGRLNLFLFGSCAGAFLFIILNFCFNTHALREWYVTFPSFSALILFISSTGFSNNYFKLKFALLILILTVYFYQVRLNNFKWDSAYDYALNLKGVTNPEDRIFQIDYSGVVGFFSERKLINGDGLINSFEYREYLKEGRLKDYLKDKRINLYSTHSENGSYDITDSSGYYVDTKYSNKFGGYDFTFPDRDLLYKMPFQYDHTIHKISGDWYLFKITE